MGVRVKFHLPGGGVSGSQRCCALELFLLGEPLIFEGLPGLHSSLLPLPAQLTFSNSTPFDMYLSARDLLRNILSLSLRKSFTTQNKHIYFQIP